MNALEIEEALSVLADQPFDPVEFPFSFLAALGNKEVTLRRLRKGDTNTSDIPGGLLQRGNIHLAVCGEGDVAGTLKRLLDSPKTATGKAKFVLATDGVTLGAEDLITGEMLACDFPQFADHFAFFLSLAGITTVKEIKESSFDIKATRRLNKLYVELLRNNPEWARSERRADMNHFMARLVFCYFAEDTDIFEKRGVFTQTIEEVSESSGSNVHQVLAEIFKAMNMPGADRPASKLPKWAGRFPYVNGGLFSGSTEVPTFTKTARSFLLGTGALHWDKINPDIFGSMIQAVADDEERGSIGMHYTSVPNILKVLNPLFLDSLRAQLDAAGDNKIKLLNLRRRMSRIRVFDPACGSGNFLVIAYKQMRDIESEINRRRGEKNARTEIPLTNFRGIELRSFPAEIARLALVIAKFQSDVLHRGQKEALADVLPLDSENWITCGNALRLDWLAICPPSGKAANVVADDLFELPGDQAEVDFENEGGETFICGNPPYLGSTWQTDEQKADLEAIFGKRVKNWASLDYVAGWFIKAADYGTQTQSAAAFVSTNSICQGQQVPVLWSEIFATGNQITFAYTSFKWANLASHNAGVTVVIVGISCKPSSSRKLFSNESSTGGDAVDVKEVDHINAYLLPGADVIVEKLAKPMAGIAEMNFGSKPVDGGHLLLTRSEAEGLGLTQEQKGRFLHRIYGSAELIRGIERYCLWIKDEDLDEAVSIQAIAGRIASVRKMRLASTKRATVESASASHRFGEVRQRGDETAIVVPSVSSENRHYLPCGFESAGTIVSNLAFVLFDAPLWNLALIASRIHLVWIGAVCGKMKTDFRYSNTLGWNTFPVPPLTDQNKADLTECAHDILLARESHFPATIAELYDPQRMPGNLRRAHERNDEVLERIYIGRKFRNDSERLEKLFDLYTKMATAQARPRKGAKAR